MNMNKNLMEKTMLITVIKITIKTMVMVMNNNMGMGTSMEISMVMEMVMGIFNLDSHKIRVNGNHILNMYLLKLKFQQYS
jgi:hypothetical protein